MAKKPSKKKPVQRTAKKTPPPHTEEEYDGSTALPDARQELFCVLYTSNTTPKFFGHGEHSYAFAYGYQIRIDEIEEKINTATTTTGRGRNKKPSQYSVLNQELKKIKNVCAAAGCRLLINVKIKARCNKLMDNMFTEEIMDRELVYVIQQRHDLPSKVRAWEMAAKLKQRIKEKAEITHVFEPVKGFTYVTPEDLPKK